MCGINGIITNIESSSDDIEMMNNAIYHRGPDDDGIFFEQSASSSVAMGMRRLSIIDLNTGKQPIYSDDLQKVIVFNGEIYNYKILKEKLIKLGFKFKTNSDTEVILKLYEAEGINAFAQLDGMFAFSIYDKTIQKVIIARDFFGEKPLYYCKSDHKIYWASEMKSILKVLPSKPSINKYGLNLFLQLTYIPAPFSIFDTIHKLEADHYMVIDCKDLTIASKKIKHDFIKYENSSKIKATQKVHDLVQESVDSRAISDVPIGTFLSGGVDSSIISLCLAQQTNKKIETFSIGFDKKSFDERDKSQTVAKLINSNHHEFIISENDLAYKLDDIILNFDEPFADSSALASYILANKSHQHVKVALSGDGGDEVFGGYNKYYMGKINSKYTSIVPKGLHNIFANYSDFLLKTNEDSRGTRFKVNRLIKAINYEGDFYYNIISLGFQENEISKLLKSEYYRNNSLEHFKNQIGVNNKTLTDFQNIDKLISLEGDMLVKVDRTSMLTSLECRAPFLNKEIWNYTNQLPESYLMKGWDKKHILKEAFKHYFPKDFLNRSKKGFGVPVGDWLRTSLSSELLSYIDKKFIEKQAIFDYEVISKVVNEHLKGKIDNTFRVWTFFCFQKWYIQYYGK